MKLQHVLMGSAAFAASVFSGYMYAKPMTALPTTGAPAADEASGSCAFDRLAGVYDSIIGSEERYMFYGLLRWWLLREAQGDVLEISAGTGRNLPHYNFSQLTSLTLTDISQPMLQQARSKYFDELQLQYKQPDVTVKFLLADAEHMVAADGQAPVTVPLPHRSRRSSSDSRAGSSTAGWRFKQGSSSSSSSSGSSSSAMHDEERQRAEQPSSVWRFKQQKQQQQQQNAIDDAAQGPEASSSSSSSSSVEQMSSTAAADSSSSTAAAPAAAAPAAPAATAGSGWWRKAPEPCTCNVLAAAANASSSSCSCSSSSGGGGSTFQPGSFDVVVDTFGLCSCRDPVQVLQQAAALLKPGGKLLLLEHGRGTWSWINSQIDDSAARHYRQYGCWYNRDILDIVQQAGLQVASSSRWHFGTSYLIVASAPAAAVDAAAEASSRRAAVAAAC